MSPRRKRFRKVGSPPVLKGYMPIGLPHNETDNITLLYEEYEAFRLADYSGLIHEKAAIIMNVSRPTFTRIYNNCVNKLAKAFAEGRPILIEGGDVEFDKQWYRCNDCAIVFHYQNNNKVKCISCDSNNIENINKSLDDWKQKQFKSDTEEEIAEYCLCTNCDQKHLQQDDIPCFTITCPECNTPLIRKDS